MLTPGLLLLALQAQGGGASDAAADQDVLHLVARSSPVSKVVLLVLILFSIASWAVILYKLWTLNRAQRQSGTFLEVFRRSSKFSEVQAVCKTLGESPLVGIFQAGYAELNTQLRQQPASAAAARPRQPRPLLRSVAALDRALLRATTVEVNKLESQAHACSRRPRASRPTSVCSARCGASWARSRASAQTGSTNLGVVAPGIADALIATAAGLFAAIPAVYFYNHLASRVKLPASEMDDFSLEFLNISERNFT